MAFRSGRVSVLEASFLSRRGHCSWLRLRPKRLGRVVAQSYAKMWVSNISQKKKKKSNLVRGLNFGPLLHVERLKPILNHVEKQKQNITIILYLCVVVFFKCPYQNPLFNQLYILHTLRLYLYVGVFFF